MTGVDDKLKRAMWLMLQDAFFNYIKFNTLEYGNGAMKAEVHIEICRTFLIVWGFEEHQWDGLHEDTQEITGYLEKLGFDHMDKEVDYHKFGKLLFDAFFARAEKYLAKNAKKLRRS